MVLCADVQVKYVFVFRSRRHWRCYVNGERVCFAGSVDSLHICCIISICAAGRGSAVAAVCAIGVCTDYPDTFCSLTLPQNDVHRVSKCFQNAPHSVSSNVYRCKLNILGNIRTQFEFTTVNLIILTMNVDQNRIWTYEYH